MDRDRAGIAPTADRQSGDALRSLVARFHRAISMAFTNKKLERNLRSQSRGFAGCRAIKARVAASPRPDRIKRWARSAVARCQSDSSGNAFLLESEPDWPQVSGRNCRSCAVQSESERRFHPRLENQSDRRGKNRHLARSLPA